ncbi:MAG: flippase-like domain-containing protein [Deltaproteobacteria bacterium]|nr:flippase-like domain-containing protein [Deltaproteobacteria bacterium]
MKSWRFLRYCLPVLGIGFLAFVIWRSGPVHLLNQIHKIGWNFFAVLLLSAINYFLFTIAWFLCLNPREPRPSFKDLFKVRTIGEAVNATTPLGFAAGDPVRGFLLKDRVAWQGLTRSIVVVRSVYIWAVVAFITVGVGFFIGTHLLSLALLTQLSSSLFLLFISLALMVFVQRRGLFSILLKGVAFVGMGEKISAIKREELAVVDEAIRQAYQTNRLRLVVAFLCHFATRCLMVVETAWILHFLGASLPFSALWAVTAMVPLVNFIFSFIPGSLGILEGMSGLAFSLLSLDPALGVSLQVIRRIRSGICVVIGWFLLLIFKSSKKGSPKVLLQPAEVR